MVIYLLSRAFSKNSIPISFRFSIIFFSYDNIETLLFNVQNPMSVIISPICSILINSVSNVTNLFTNSDQNYFGFSYLFRKFWVKVIKDVVIYEKSAYLYPYFSHLVQVFG